MVFGQTGSMEVKVKATGVVPTGRCGPERRGRLPGCAGRAGRRQAVVTLAANKLPASGPPYTVTIKYSGDEFVKPAPATPPTCGSRTLRRAFR